MSDHLPHLLLGWRLLVASALATRYTELLERVAVDQPASLYRRRVVEHRTQALHGPGSPTAREPVRDDLISNMPDRDIAVVDTYISRIETGRAQPSFRLILAIANQLDTTPAELFDGIS